MKQIKRLVSNKAKCLRCNDIIESKHRHDFVMCSCESIFVDGGTDYIRRGGTLALIEDLSTYSEPVSEEAQK
jgi:hypothetical protein